MTARPRRSCLYMPGANAKALEKAKTLPADVLLLDLEDSVAPEAKETARDQVASAVRGGGYGKREVVVRINGVGTPWCADDLQELVTTPPDGVLVPKVETAKQIHDLGVALDILNDGYILNDQHVTPSRGVALWIMIETPRAIFNLPEIVAAAAESRL
ncbi:MAG: aldolase/citrate lyase family protein, partial [Terricaulis sp.]